MVAYVDSLLFDTFITWATSKGQKWIAYGLLHIENIDALYCLECVITSAILRGKISWICIVAKLGAIYSMYYHYAIIKRQKLIGYGDLEKQDTLYSRVECIMMLNKLKYDPG